MLKRVPDKLIEIKTFSVQTKTVISDNNNKNVTININKKGTQLEVSLHRLAFTLIEVLLLSC
jgi:hypothetical protein